MHATNPTTRIKHKRRQNKTVRDWSLIVRHPPPAASSYRDLTHRMSFWSFSPAYGPLSMNT